VKCASAEEIVHYPDEGLPKLWVVYRTLALRQARPELFGPDATYEPMAAQGSKAGHVVAFMRAQGAITVVPRLVLGLASNWENTSLRIPDGRWRNELDGERIEGGAVQLSKLTSRFPVCLLVREEGQSR
jgi:(1->4)-alpha-D-glucan 1-alpha-D-glucosylmutase